MSGYVGSDPSAAPFDGSAAPPQRNALQDYVDQLSHLHGFTSQLAPPSDWPYANNPVGTETTQSMGAPSAADNVVAFHSASGVPIMQSDLDRAHGQLAAAMQTAPTMALGMVGDAPGAVAEAPQAAALRVYHGTPHSFPPVPDNPLGAFDLSKIGTGEGAQVYGHGIYVAENPNTAASYRESVPGTPTFDHSALGGPPDASVGVTKEWLGDAMADNPDLAHIDDATLRAAAEHVVNHLGAGNDPAMASKWLGRQLLTPEGAEAAQAAVDHMGGVKLNYQGPTVGGEPFDFSDPVHQAAAAVYKAGGDHDAAIAKLDKEVGWLDPQHHSDQVGQVQQWRSIIDNQRGSLPTYKPQGHGYEAEIATPPEDFLHWDKPFSQQSPKVQAALTPQGLGLTPAGPFGLKGYHGWVNETGVPVGRLQTGAPPEAIFDPRETGQGIYRALTDANGLRREGADALASQQLLKAGVPGIRYLDQGSRGTAVTPQQVKDSLSDIAYYQDLLAGKGAPLTSSERISAQTALGTAQQQHAALLARQGKNSHNLVLFDTNIARIVRRYGIAALLGGGGAAALAQGGQAPQQQ